MSGDSMGGGGASPAWLVERRCASPRGRGGRRTAAHLQWPHPCRRPGFHAAPLSSSASAARTAALGRRPRNATPRGSSFAHDDVSADAGAAQPLNGASLRMSSFGTANLFSLHSSRQHTPRLSSFDEHVVRARSATAVALSYDPKDMPTFEWSSGGASAASEVSGLPVFRGGDYRAKDVRRLVPSEVPPVDLSRAMLLGERVASFKEEAVQDALAKLESGSTTDQRQNVKDNCSPCIVF